MSKVFEGTIKAEFDVLPGTTPYTAAVLIEKTMNQGVEELKKLGIDGLRVTVETGVKNVRPKKVEPNPAPAAAPEAPPTTEAPIVTEEPTTEAPGQEPTPEPAA